MHEEVIQNHVRKGMQKESYMKKSCMKKPWEIMYMKSMKNKNANGSLSRTAIQIAVIVDIQIQVAIENKNIVATSVKNQTAVHLAMKNDIFHGKNK